jgi:hypothetical protein
VGSREAIARLIYACDDHNDRGDFEGVGALFEHGTVRVKNMDGSWTGTDAVATQFAHATKVYPVGDGTSALTHHLSTNLVIDVDEDAGTATARSYYTMLQGTDDLPLQIIDAGYNTDRFECVDGEWRWIDRYITVELHGDLTHHLHPRTTPFA